VVPGQLVRLKNIRLGISSRTGGCTVRVSAIGFGVPLLRTSASPIVFGRLIVQDFAKSSG